MTTKELFKQWKRQAKELGVWDVPVETGCGHESLLLFPKEGDVFCVTFVFDDSEENKYKKDVVVKVKTE